MLEKYQTIEECFGSNGKLLEILKMSMSKHEQVVSVEAYRRRWLAKNPMHMITRSPFALIANSQTKKKFGTEPKKKKHNKIIIIRYNI